MAAVNTSIVEPVRADEVRKRANFIQSVDRALSILDTLSQAREGIALNDISARTGLNVSTCHHLLATLSRRGYVTRAPSSKAYALGNKIFELSAARARQIDVVGIASPVLRALNEMTREAVHLAAMQGRELITLAKLDSRHAVGVDSGMVGKSGAAHATATGKAILAWLPESEIRAIIAESGMQPYTGQTIQRLDALFAQLALVRRHGFAEDREEFQPGVYCIGCAIRDHSGGVIASLSVSIPTMRATPAHLADVREQVKQAALDVSQQLGSTTAP